MGCLITKTGPWKCLYWNFEMRGAAKVSRWWVEPFPPSPCGHIWERASSIHKWETGKFSSRRRIGIIRHKEWETGARKNLQTGGCWWRCPPPRWPPRPSCFCGWPRRGTPHFLTQSTGKKLYLSYHRDSKRILFVMAGFQKKVVIQSRNIFFLKNWFAEEGPPWLFQNTKCFWKFQMGGAPLLVVKIDKEMGHPVLLDIPTMIKVGKVVWHWRVSLSREDGRHRRFLSLELLTPSRWIYFNQFVSCSPQLILTLWYFHFLCIYDPSSSPRDI